MPAGSLARIDDAEAAFAPITSLAGTEDMVLVAAAKSGSSRAFEALVERHARKIFFAARRITRTLEDAEDVVQQSLLNAFVHLQQFAGESSFSTWLTRIAVNEALMLLRRSRGLREVPMDDANANQEAATVVQIPDSKPDPEVSCSQRERERILFSAMNGLTPGIRAAIQLRELDERSVKESARMMGVSVAATKSRVLRGRRKLRETLKRRVAPAWRFGSDTLQSNAGTNGNSRSPAACVVRAKVNGGRHGDDLTGTRAVDFGVSVPRRPRRRFRAETSLLNRAPHSSGRPEDKLSRRAPLTIGLERSL